VRSRRPQVRRTPGFVPVQRLTRTRFRNSTPQAAGSFGNGKPVAARTSAISCPAILDAIDNAGIHAVAEVRSTVSVDLTTTGVVVNYTLCINVNCNAGTDSRALMQVSKQNLGP
jgi:hypothetical protein